MAGQFNRGGFENQIRNVFHTGSFQSSGVDGNTVRLTHQAPAAPQMPPYGSGPGPAVDARRPCDAGNSSAPPQQRQHQGQQYRPNQRDRRAQNAQGRGSYPTPSPGYPSLQLQAHHYQNPPIDPNAFQRGAQVAGYYPRPAAPPRQLYNPNVPHGQLRGPPPVGRNEQHLRQERYLNELAEIEVSKVNMSQQEIDEKEGFRHCLEKIIHDVCAAAPDRLPPVTLEAFGSFKSGFANAGSDMDLVIVLPNGSPHTASRGLLEDDLPRALERELLQLGIGARLLTRTRVPIIKICEKPDDCILDKLRQEREKWDMLPNEKKYPHLHPEGEEDAGVEGEEAIAGARPEVLGKLTATPPAATADATTEPTPAIEALANLSVTEAEEEIPPTPTHQMSEGAQAYIREQGKAPDQTLDRMKQPRRDDRPFTRERKAGPLDFPKSGVGIQSDINFFNPLGLHNTQLLRCYSLCDPRVKPMVLFIKSWAKKRKINSSYSGTLSSYGYVLMVLHYLVNIAQPPVLPNLQGPWRPNPHCTPQGASRIEVDGWTVDFWRSEPEILSALQSGQLSANTQSLGSLLLGFFQYYSSLVSGPQFIWKSQVLSLRTPGGILSKEEKGWTRAVTEEGEGGRRIQQRYLFCIEDPFELAHNVARTVTHHGIVAIRDEFRRGMRILTGVGYGQVPKDGQLFEEMVEEEQRAEKPEWFDGAKDASTGTAAQQAAAKPRHHIPRPDNRIDRGGGTTLPSAQRPLDVKDTDAFPSLGCAAAKPKSRPTGKGDGANMSEISGDNAKEYLAELQRKKQLAAQAGEG